MLIPRVQEHTECLLVACDPYGTSRTCTRTYLLQLSALILCCQSHIPTFPGPPALIETHRKLIKRILTQHFTALSTTFDDSFYMNYVIRLKKLSVLVKHLASLPHLQHQVSLCISQHDMFPPSSTITASFLNLYYLQEQLAILKTSTEIVFFDILDSNPHRAEVQLKSLMREVRIFTWCLAWSWVLFYRQLIIGYYFKERFSTSHAPILKPWGLVDGWMMKL